MHTDISMKRFLAISVLALAASPAVANDEGPAVPPPPVIPEPVHSGEALEPEVTIVESDKGTAYEYRVNGLLYMVKVQPVVGPPYYLLDLDGDGQLDVRQDQPWNNSIPQWILFSW
jgi:Protein of unknown function (DUF2782)